MRILVDLDCVLGDFVGAVCERWGVSRADLHANWVHGEYGIEKPLGRALGLGRSLTEKELWDNVKGDSKFWEGIKPLPWSGALVALVQSLTPDWHVISSPTRCPSCYAGKVAWLKNHFGEDFNRFALTPHKEIFAGPGVALIDDHLDNIEKFMYVRIKSPVDGSTRRLPTGGKGILFPHHHNSLHEHADDPLNFLRGPLVSWARKEQRNAYAHP